MSFANVPHLIPVEDEEEHDANTDCWCDTTIHMLEDGTIICEHFDYWEREARFRALRSNLSAA